MSSNVVTTTSVSLPTLPTVLGGTQGGITHTSPSVQRPRRVPAHRHAVTEKVALQVGPYELGSRIGIGGTATVFEATHSRTAEAVAIKIQRVADGRGGAAGVILDNEAQILGHLSHPSVLPLLDRGQLSDGRRWLALPLLAGGDLHSLHRKLLAGEDLEAWPLRRRMAAFLALCAAVEHAHAHGVVHRDVKPRNVMFDEYGFVYLADWGLAGPPTNPPGPNEPAPSTAGTPGYMAPEQIAPRLARVDARADVWSLGAVLYEMLTLRRAISGRTVTERMAATLAGSVRNPQELNPEVPDVLAFACQRAMQRDAELRYRSVLDLAIAVGSGIGGL